MIRGIVFLSCWFLRISCDDAKDIAYSYQKMNTRRILFANRFGLALGRTGKHLNKISTFSTSLDHLESRVSQLESTFDAINKLQSQHETSSREIALKNLETLKTIRETFYEELKNEKVGSSFDIWGVLLTPFRYFVG